MGAAWQNWWIGAAILLFAGMVAAWLVRLQVRKLRRAKQAQDVFLQRLIETQEQERRRIAIELHDGLGQTLLNVKNRANLAAKVSGLPAAVVAQLEEISSSALDAIDEVRSIVRDLRPATLDRLGLTRALNAMLSQLLESGQIRLACRVDDLDGALPPEREINIYRVVQEGLNNVLKHSRAANVRVDVLRSDGMIVVEIEDDGCGFDLESVDSATGIGLAGIRERIHILGGAMEIRSKVGEGALLRAEIPVLKNR